MARLMTSLGRARMNAADEQRAAAYRAQQITRATATVARDVALRGSGAARAALELAWAPVLYRDEAFGRPDLHDAGTTAAGPNPLGPETN